MERVPGRLALALLVLVTFAAGWFSLHNLDIWLHARTGQWIVEHGEVPTVNVMSRLHADWPTVDDKWGFQVVAHLLLDGLGPDACNAARLALLLGLLLVCWSTARRGGAGPWWTLGALLLALLASRTRFTFRPDLVSLLLTAIVARAMLAPGSGVERGLRGRLWLVPLQLLWVNVHGYFITGPLVVLAAAAGRALAGRGQLRLAARLGGLAALMLATCLINPAGLDGWLHPFAIVADLHEHAEFYRQAIIEFRPPFAADPQQPWDRWGYFALVALGAVLLPWEWLAARRAAHAAGAGESAGVTAAAASVSASASGDRLVALALFALFFAMSLSIRRNMAPFAIVAAPLVAVAGSRRFPPWQATIALPLAGAVLLAAGELSDTISIHDGLDRRSGHGLSRLAYPDAGIDFIARELPASSVFTAFSYGSTFTGRRWPEQAASTDGNTHGYPTSYLIEVMSALSGDDPTVFDRIVARDGEQVALVPMAGPLSMELLGDPHWALVCLGLREAVFVQRAAMDPGWLAVHDLAARWRAGEAPELPGTPDGGTWLGLPKACAPLAEVDQSLVLLRLGLVEAALRRIDAALDRCGGDAESWTLRGLALERQGRREEAKLALQTGLAARGFNRLEAEARAHLEQL
jgi:hypothetical protein